MKVLLIDDCRATRGLVSMILGKSGCNVILASDHASADEAIRAHTDSNVTLIDGTLGSGKEDCDTIELIDLALKCGHKNIVAFSGCQDKNHLMLSKGCHRAIHKSGNYAPSLRKLITPQKKP